MNASHFISIQIDAVNALAVSIVNGPEIEARRLGFSILLFYSKGAISPLILVIMVFEASISTKIGRVIILIIIIVGLLIFLVNVAEWADRDIDLA